MKRWFSHFVIVAYLGALGGGIFAHTMKVGTGAHAGMYFLVWDMFCGWGAFSGRTHIIGEGESGKYYELAPGPWGEIRPYGNLGRRHYDVRGSLAPRLIKNVLRHSKHEPITRVIVVEECWSKKYNLPDHLWARRYSEPKETYKYYNVRSVYSDDGTLISWFPSFYDRLMTRSLMANPRITADSKRSKPMYIVNSHHPMHGNYSFHPHMGGPSNHSFASAPLGD